jgi:uncharacterized protein YceK
MIEFCKRNRATILFLALILVGCFTIFVYTNKDIALDPQTYYQRDYDWCMRHGGKDPGLIPANSSIKAPSVMTSCELNGIKYKYDPKNDK